MWLWVEYCPENVSRKLLRNIFNLSTRIFVVTFGTTVMLSEIIPDSTFRTLPWRWRNVATSQQTGTCIQTTVRTANLSVRNSCRLAEIKALTSHIQSHAIYCLTSCLLIKQYRVHEYGFQQTNFVAWVLERTIRTERPSLVGEASANFFG
jgi:hypothetical protein